MIDNVHSFIPAISKWGGYEIVELPTSLHARYGGKYAKLAYGKIYALTHEDFEIELEQIKSLEANSTNVNSLYTSYKHCISIIAPDIASGWNDWADNILTLFLSNELYKVILGSGNCGKSAIMGLLTYIHWRVNPTERLTVIASSVLSDSSARVFSYIKGIHANAPIGQHRFAIVDNALKKGIFALVLDKDSGKLIQDDRACIISLPVKTNAKRGETGANLIGKHPKDVLTYAFDEAQELPGHLLEERFFLNVLTNNKLNITAWGNPPSIDWNMPESWDLLNKLAFRDMTLSKVRSLERDAHTTGWWTNGADTKVLHISMVDSPKDKDPDGDTRLSFLAGKLTVEKIIAQSGIAVNTPAYYSQVLGFPYIDSSGKNSPGVLSPAIVSEAREYPLRWRDETACRWFMGVDSSGTGHGDETAIAVGRLGLMIDGRLGIDLLNGRYCKTVTAKHGDEVFTDEVLDAIHSTAKELRIPLRNIALETHGSGEVLRYGIQKYVSEKGWWDGNRKADVLFINPTISCTDRMMFKVLSKSEPANEICSDINTEMWLAIRCCFLSKQMFNVPDSMLKQLYNRILDKNSSGTKYRLESKRDMRKRGVKSPNDADALANLTEIIRVRGGFSWRFISGGYYKEKYGVAYDEERLRRKAHERVGRATRLLQMGHSAQGKYYGGGV